MVVEGQAGGRIMRGAGQLTVAEYLRQWLVDKERDGARPKTLESYRYHVERIWIPAVGKKRIRELDAGLIEEALRRVRER